MTKLSYSACFLHYIYSSALELTREREEERRRRRVRMRKTSESLSDTRTGTTHFILLRNLPTSDYLMIILINYRKRRNKTRRIECDLTDSFASLNDGFSSGQILVLSIKGYKAFSNVFLHATRYK